LGVTAAVSTDPVRVARPRWSAIRGLFSRGEWTRLGAMFAVVAALHVIGWGTLVFLVAPAFRGR
jgi:high-affinity nickel-transport protein